MHSTHYPASRTRLARAITLAIALCSLALTGCPAGVEDLSGTNGTISGGTGGVTPGGGGGTQATGLVGQWTRAILLQGPDGDIRESRTTWDFRADRSAVRSVTAWNWTTGYYDTVYSVAQWSTSGSTMTIVYITGSGGTLTLAYRLDGDVLTLGPDQYARVK
jgi:hypothetical protein